MFRGHVNRINVEKFCVLKEPTVKAESVCLTSLSVSPMPVTKLLSALIPDPLRRPVPLCSISELPTHFFAEWRRTAHEWTSRESAIPARTAALCTTLINPATRCLLFAKKTTSALILATAHLRVELIRSAPMIGRSATAAVASISAQRWNAQPGLASSVSVSLWKLRVHVLWVHHLAVRKTNGAVWASSALICVSDRRVLRIKNVIQNQELVRLLQLAHDLFINKKNEMKKKSIFLFLNMIIFCFFSDNFCQ